MTVDEKIDRLISIVETLAGTVVAHDNQIGALITTAEKHSAQLASTEKAIASTQKAIESLERQWQAYANRLPRR
jgi:hypothetical protein